MNTETLWSAMYRYGTVAIVLLCLLAPMLSASAQEPLSLTVKSRYFIVNTTNEETMANFVENIVITPDSNDVELSCDPPPGTMFPRGATEVTCTATLGEESQTESFIVLVANEGDTDAEVGPVSQDFAVVEPAGFVTYNVEYRGRVNFARNVEISTTLPPQVRFVRTNEANCDGSAAPTITCVFYGVFSADSFTVTVQTLPPFVGTYEVEWSLRLLPDAGSDATQLDLYAGNNVASISTEVRQAAAQNQLFLPLLSE